MTEEKRIFSKNGYVLFYNEPMQWWDWERCGMAPTPVTKSTFKKVIKNYFYEETRDLINFISIDEFWDKYGTPVPEKKWYVKVPHTYPSSWYQIGQCNDSTMIITNIECVPNDSFKFTDSEIKKYHLEDCEKVPADE
ncbi:hypothetical protein [Lactobacillus sp. ESL0679]|uniref:hypothetical protein n=1 Tax=Lactobacillus sp. ESL0679 TaxID=2983209 RepID=UPI0023F942CC|nr:hypothetical protein [Lactobacillus sp. ESL0679]